MKTRHLLPLLLCALALSSCHTPEENAAIDFIKRHCKSPSSFSLISVDSYKHNDPSETNVDTIFWYKGERQAASSRIATPGSYRATYAYNREIKFDSISYIIEHTAPHSYTSVTVTFEAKNAFGASIKDTEFVYVENGRSYSIYDFCDLHKTQETKGGVKYKKRQKRMMLLEQ